MRLRGRTAAVVGVGSSIGRACAVRFADEGAHVLAVDPDGDVAHAVAREIAERGGSALSHAADLRSMDGAASAAARCEELWGSLEILALCSSDRDWWPPAEDSVDRWESVIRTNLIGPIAYTKALAPLLRRSGSGSIVYLSSVDGLRGNANIPSYSVSKGALIPLTHVMAQEFGRYGVRVNCIATAAIDQSGTGSRPYERVIADENAERLRLTPLGRNATPEDVAAVALFFASSDSAYVTGTILPVDGGRIAITPGTIPHDAPDHI